MLTPEYLDGLPEPVTALYQQAEDAILADMARRIVNTDLWTPSADWQYRKLREAGALSEDIIAELARITKKSRTEIRKLMQDAAIESMGYDEGIYETHGMTGEPLASSEALTSILNAGYRATMQTMRNLTRTTAAAASRQFVTALDEAWMKVQSGAFSADAAVRDAVKGLAESGVECIKYPSGRKDTLEVAVRRAVVTGVNQTCGQMQLERAKEMGADLMEITAHEGARPSHAEWQGQIVSLSGQPGYLTLEGIGYGDVAGFKGANCRHDWNPWFEGMPRTWTPEALAKLNEPRYEYDGKKLTQYEASQVQRYNERQIRKWKRVYAAQKAAGQDTTEAAAKISEWNKRQGDFLRQTGFKRRQSREEIAGFGLKETREASVDLANLQKPVEISSTMQRADATFEYVQAENPKTGAVMYGADYEVDGHPKEIMTADWIAHRLGGEIKLLTESEVENVKNPDYLWRGKLWDQKSTSSAKAANSAIHKGLKQIAENPGGIILDYSIEGAAVDWNELIGVIDKRMQWYHRDDPIDIIVIFAGKNYRVVRYSKKA